MQTHTLRSKAVTASALAALVGASLMALAEPTPDNSPPRRPPARELAPGERPQPGQPPTAFVPLVDRVLTQEQRASLREAMAAQQDKMRELLQKLGNARKEVQQATFTEKLDEGALRQKALEVGKLEADITVLRAKAFTQVKPPLSSEQFEKLKNPPPLEMGRTPSGPRPELRPRVDRPEPGPRGEDAPPPPAPPKP